MYTFIVCMYICIYIYIYILYTYVYTLHITYCPQVREQRQQQVLRHVRLGCGPNGANTNGYGNNGLCTVAVTRISTIIGCWLRTKWGEH